MYRMTMESLLDDLKIQDKQIFEDLMVYRSHDVHRLLKRLDLIHKILQDADQKGHLKQVVPTATNQFLQTVLQCYYRCIESIKLARSVEKLLQPWRLTHKDYIQDKLSAFVSSITSKENPDLTSLTTVSNLLEHNLVVRNVVEEKLVPFLVWIEGCLETLKRKTPSDLSTNEAGNLYTLVKIVLQLFQSCPLGRTITETPEGFSPQKEAVESLLTVVYSILDTDGYATDCVLLAGTTFSYVLSTASSPAVTVSAFWSTFMSLHNPDIQFSTESLRGSRHTSSDQINASYRKSLGAICLVKGIVACSSTELLCYHGNNQSNTFITDLFPVIVGYCCGPINLHFHSFSLLLSWYKKCSICLTKNDNFHVECIERSDIFSQTLNLVYLNWDSPVEDVAEIVGEIFRMMLECWNTITTKNKTSPNNIDNDLSGKALSKLETTPWYVKGKYRILAVLLSYVDQDKILTRCPEIRQHLQQCMSTNYLAPCGADVYKAFLLQIRLLRSNTNHYWVQSTLKVLPSVGDFLQEHLSGVLYAEDSSLPRQQVLHAWVVVSKVTRNNTGKEAEDSALLREALYSSSEETRAEAISLICSSLRKAESLSERDCKLLMEILPHNLKIDSAPFRQHLGASMKKLLSRIRDSCLAELRVGKDISLGLTFVEWLQSLCVDSLMSGACYQRRKTCLDLLTILYDTLVYQTDSKQRKSFTPESTLTLVSHARDEGVWDFFSTSNTVCLLHCLCDGADEIQEMCASLLMKYFQWPLSSSWIGMTQEDLACHLLTHALNCCNSPKASESQSGALLTKIIFTKYVVEHGWTFDMTLTKDGACCSVLPLNTPEKDNAVVIFLRTLISFIVKTMETSKTNVVLASKTSPVHGFVAASTRCITETPDLLYKHSSDLDTVAKEMISLDIVVIDTMLKVMARDSEMEMCPSFAEIGSALESWIAESEDSYTETTSLSAEYQYLLSWCWINLKESCKSLGHLTDVLDQKDEKVVETVHRISQVFSNILTNCRHKGVIEGCRSAFSRYCFSLFTSSNRELNQMPELILKESLSTLVTKATSTSTTRMSAGLPIIIQTIVSCERKYKKTKLLQTALDSLFHITSLPLAAELDDKFDLPQVHGLNILNSLYSDSSLTASLTPYIEGAVKLVVDSFGSPAWAIRNAATRLFSSLVTKMFGPRKSLEEGACNTLSFQEFASHYPELPPFMLRELDKALLTDISAVDKLHPSLFPVLTLLSHLGPTVQQQQSQITEFQGRIQFLLASPVYYLRQLTASAFVAMVPVNSVRDTLIGLLKDIPENLCPSHMCNRLHGTLLCLEKILVIHNISEADASEVMGLLKTRAWIGCDPAVCPLIKHTFLTVLSRLIQIFPGTVRSAGQHLVMLIQKCATSQYHRRVNLGHGVLTKNLVQCILTSEDWETGNRLLHDLLHSSDMDAKLACVSTLECVLESGTWQASCWTTIQGMIMDVLQRETYPVLLTNCLSLLFSIHNTHGTDPDTADQLYQYCCDNGKGGQGSVKAAVLAVTAIGIKNCIDTSRPPSPDVMFRWCDQVLNASRMIGDEHFRLAAAQAMVTAGHAIMTTSWSPEDVSHQNCVVKLFQAMSNLVQDDDTEVRVLAMKFIPHLCYKGRSIQYGAVQCNTGYQLLFEYLHTSYWWSEAVVSTLVQMLYQPKDVRTCITNKLTACNQQLFEQEDDTFCIESIFTRLQVYKSLKFVVSMCEDRQSNSSVQCLSEPGQALSNDLKFVEDFINKHVDGKPVFSLGMDTAVLSAIAGCVLFGLVLVEARFSPEDSVCLQLQNILSNPNLPPSLRRAIDGINKQDGNFLDCDRVQ
ncbi:thyroid adenoma-associated protein homolog isoform X2 [Pecten maximus]|uniref:thyroid adenoma-associated protein homolog isoform X2 n=1 Tax=Pecten maximus TaxID=6579 RepID=UPI001458C282|nr:thyroid adenoma-associated protein homolog isoform X2 [Pecten maximus]